MKVIAFAAALMIGGTALAQGAANPERDARGIPVMSNPSSAPEGANQAPPTGAGPVVPAANQQAVFATKPSAGEAPPCSRTVTDGCTQTYERGRKPS